MKKTGAKFSMVIIPFAAAVPEERRKEQLYQQLLLEAPYIVSQAIDAYRDLMENNFSVTRTQIPPEYQTADSRKSVVFITDFIRNCCILDDDAETATNELFLAYQENCIAEGQEILNQTEFSRTFSGIIRSMPSVSPIKRTNGQDSRGYRGIRLTD